MSSTVWAPPTGHQPYGLKPPRGDSQVTPSRALGLTRRGPHRRQLASLPCDRQRAHGASNTAAQPPRPGPRLALGRGEGKVHVSPVIILKTVGDGRDWTFSDRAGRARRVNVCYGGRSRVAGTQEPPDRPERAVPEGPTGLRGPLPPAALPMQGAASAGNTLRARQPFFKDANGHLLTGRLAPSQVQSCVCV